MSVSKHLFQKVESCQFRHRISPFYTTHISRYSIKFKKYYHDCDHSSTAMESNSSLTVRFFKWSALGICCAVVGYFALRQYSIAHCSSKNIVTKDPVKDFLADLKNVADDKSDMWLKNVKSSFFTKGILEAFDIVDEIMDNLNEFGLSGAHYQTPRLVLLGMIKRVHEERYNRSKLSLTDHQNTQVISHERFEFARHIGQFAVNLYYASWLSDVVSISKAMGLPSSDDILLTWFQDSGDDHCPKFIIFLDHNLKGIILAVRGTFSLSDAIADIVCDEDPFLDGYAHRGILNGARKILRESESTLTEALRTHPDYELILTGHSLGAGTAELIAMNILYNKVDFIDPTSTSIRCVALAPPPVYRSDVKIPKEVKNMIEIYINNNDCVPRLSLAVVAKLLAMMKAVDSLQLSTYEQLQILAGFKDTKTQQNLQHIEDAMTEVQQERFPYLQHPGVIYYMQRRNDKLLLEKQKSGFFSTELLFLETMILDHLHMYYKDAMNKISFSATDEDSKV